MELVADSVLEDSPVVANCCMNRERNLHGSNGYARDLHFDPLGFLRAVATDHGKARWLDLCCGTGQALVEAAIVVETEGLPIKIVGVDLVGMFQSSASVHLELIEASLSDWKPNGQVDLITCVHGLHYIGDKLDLIARAISWLLPNGRFVANLDTHNLHLQGGSRSDIIAAIRQAGIGYDARRRLLRCDTSQQPCFPFTYVGANDQAGPNYTGQPAVDSHYQLYPPATTCPA